MMDISKEFQDLKSAVNMGRVDGRQKGIEKAFKTLEKAMAEPFEPKLSLWTIVKRGFSRSFERSFNRQVEKSLHRCKRRGPDVIA